VTKITSDDAYRLLDTREVITVSLRTSTLFVLVAVCCAGILAACTGVQPTPTAAECVSSVDGVLVNSDCIAPGITPDPTATPTPPPATVPNGGGGGGRAVFQQGGCSACHTLDGIATGQVGPNLTGIGSRHDAAYIRESIVNPSAVIAPECPTGPCSDIMPKTFGTTFSPEQLDALVEFLAGQR
jgi:hypothetical protein